ncbi:MAG: AI-2E family transporter [Pseudomonadota bacterium]
MIDSQRRAMFWIVLVAACGLALWRLSDILLPFIMGLAVAYFLDPLVDWLERYRFPRTLATVIVIAVFTALLVALLILVVPLFERQILDLLKRLPSSFSEATHAARCAVAPAAAGSRDTRRAAAKHPADDQRARLGDAELVRVQSRQPGHQRSRGGQSRIAAGDHAGGVVLHAARLGSPGRAHRQLAAARLPPTRSAPRCARSTAPCRASRAARPWCA